MDSSFLVRQRQPLHKSYAPRDLKPVRGITESELDPSQTVPTSEREQQEERGEHQREQHDAPPMHASPTITVDPAASEMLQQQMASSGGAHDLPAQALQQLRAYSQSQPAATGQASGEAADIEA